MSTKIILKPSITEKSMILAPMGQLTFFVNRQATKASIALEVETLFKVDVLKVRLVNKPGKTKKTGKKRQTLKTQPLRKAIITLKPGQSIDYFKLPDEKTTKTLTKDRKPVSSAPKSSKNQNDQPKQKSSLLGQLRKITTLKQPE